MGDVFAFRSENVMVAGKSGADKRSSPGVGLRKTLGDLTNIQPRNRQSIVEHKVELVNVSAKGTDRLNKEIESLKKENLILKKQLAERNKIVELSAIELQTLRENFQTLYQQNVQLAQANSQMLAELNSGKDRLKTLHHELGCVKGLLNVKTMELQEKKDVVGFQRTIEEVPAIKSEEAKEPSQVGHGKTKRSSTNPKCQSKVTGKSVKEATDKEKSESKRLCVRRQSSRFIKSEEANATEEATATEEAAATDKEKSESKRFCARRQSSRFIKSEETNATEEATTTEEAAATDKEKSESKRFCARRQSSRFTKSEEANATEDFFELEDIKLPMSQAHDTSQRVRLAREDLSDAEKDAIGWKSSQSQATEARRLSIGRPSRRAAEKVQSYKEAPLNVKMRRNC